MSVLQTTLRSVLAHADELFEAGRVPAARSAYEDLLERAQERVDRPMEVLARAMLARCHLKRKDPDAARAELDQAAERLLPGHVESEGRFRASRARLSRVADPPEAALQEARGYLEWAETAGAWGEAVDACQLVAEQSAEDGPVWIQRAIDIALEHGVDTALGSLYTDLAVVHERDARLDDALDAWRQALEAWRRTGTPRQVAGSAWAVGVLACRIEDWPLGQEQLEEAVRVGEGHEDCADLLALALAELSKVHEASGDVVEARRVLLRALALAREQDLPRLWPARWDELVEQAKRLEIEA